MDSVLYTNTASLSSSPCVLFILTHIDIVAFFLNCTAATSVSLSSGFSTVIVKQCARKCPLRCALHPVLSRDGQRFLSRRSSLANNNTHARARAQAGC